MRRRKLQILTFTIRRRWCFGVGVYGNGEYNRIRKRMMCARSKFETCTMRSILPVYIMCLHFIIHLIFLWNIVKYVPTYMWKFPRVYNWCLVCIYYPGVSFWPMCHAPTSCNTILFSFKPLKNPCLNVWIAGANLSQVINCQLLEVYPTNGRWRALFFEIENFLFLSFKYS